MRRDGDRCDWRWYLLVCGKPFESDWIGNRICTPCIRIANKSATNEDLAEAS